MSTTLCGHEREVLIAQLQCLTSDGPDFLRSSAEAWEVLDRGDRVQRVAMERAFEDAFDALNDPAKLAELMAEELRRRGIKALAIDCTDVDAILSDADTVVWHYDDNLAVETRASNSGPLARSQARTALLRLMQLPEGTPIQDVLKALKVTHNG